MNVLFLFNDAIDLDDFSDFKNGMLELNLLKSMSSLEDKFCKHASVWSLDVIEFLNSAERDQYIGLIYLFLEQISDVDGMEYITNEAKFDELFPVSKNLFLGINFSGLDISEHRQIVSSTAFLEFKNKELSNISFRNFWSKRQDIFKFLIFCKEVEAQISRIGQSSLFNQIISKLSEFDSAISDWSSGNFSYKRVNDKYALRISPETLATMSAYGSQRKFSLPDGRSEFFELHI